MKIEQIDYAYAIKKRIDDMRKVVAYARTNGVGDCVFGVEDGHGSSEMGYSAKVEVLPFLSYCEQEIISCKKALAILGIEDV